MTHQEFLKSLTDEQKQALTERSNNVGLIQLGVHLCLIALNSVLLLNLPGVLSSVIMPGAFIGSCFTFVSWFLLSISQGILLVFLFTLLHETTHHTPFESITLNRVIGAGCGMVLFLPAQWFRHFHLAHHRYTHVADKDPELASPKPDSIPTYLAYLSGIPVWKSHITTLLVNAAGRCNDAFVPESRKALVHLEARLMMAGYLAILVLSVVTGTADLLFKLWLIPVLLGQPFLRAYLLAEHAGCEHSNDMFTNSRTTLTRRLVYRLAWNMPYHAEHHAYPSVPFFRLPELHQLTEKHLRVKQDGYWGFNRDYCREAK